jgi:protein-tyrosine phosphatase
MLKSAADQKIDLMIATPHFYASRDTIDAFLRARAEAYVRLEKAIDESGTVGLPRIRLGAEVAYFKGVSDADRVDELTIQGTDVLLLELPFDEWRGHVARDVRHLVHKRSIRVVLAHLERYLHIRANRRELEELLALPLLVQINAESLTSGWQRRRLIRMFEEGEAHLLGSDCHGMGSRPPNLAAGREALRQSVGQALLDQIDQRGAGLLEESS